MSPKEASRVVLTHTPGVYTVRLSGIPVATFHHLEAGDADLVGSDPSHHAAASESKRDARERARQLERSLRRALGIVVDASEENRLQRLADALLPAIIIRRQLERIGDKVDRDPAWDLVTAQDEAWARAENHIETGQAWLDTTKDEPLHVIRVEDQPKGPLFEQHRIRGAEDPLPEPQQNAEANHGG